MNTTLYDVSTAREGNNTISKFKTTLFGTSSLQAKNQRFKSPASTHNLTYTALPVHQPTILKSLPSIGIPKEER